tara:strand:- start:372 stop:797 length:426 start_codon:yes stop_codon:yes gene_type:complete
MNVLIEILGKQFKAAKGDKLRVPYINKKIGEKLTFDNILYSDDGKTMKLGKPYLKDLQMEAKLLDHGKEDKVIVFKFKRRKGYQKRNGHQQRFSLIEVSNFKKKVAKKATTKKAATETKSSTPKKTTTKKASPKKDKKGDK